MAYNNLPGKTALLSPCPVGYVGMGEFRCMGATWRLITVTWCTCCNRHHPPRAVHVFTLTPTTFFVVSRYRHCGSVTTHDQLFFSGSYHLKVKYVWVEGYAQQPNQLWRFAWVGITALHLLSCIFIVMVLLRIGYKMSFRWSHPLFFFCCWLSNRQLILEISEMLGVGGEMGLLGPFPENRL